MRVIVPLADGFEEVEAITLIDVLRRGGVEVVSLSLDESGLDVEGAHGIGIVADETWNEDDLAAADMIIVPGGMRGVRELMADVRVLEAIRMFDEQGKRIGAICAGPLVLQAAGVLQGRKVTCYPGIEGELTGALPQSSCAVVQDGNLLTGTGPATAMVFALAVLDLLVGGGVRERAAEALLFM